MNLSRLRWKLKTNRLRDVRRLSRDRAIERLDIEASIVETDCAVEAACQVCEINPRVLLNRANVRGDKRQIFGVPMTNGRMSVAQLL